MMLFNVLLLLIAAYCVGAVPSGFILSRYLGVDDIRNYGSGNIGATNIGRMFGLKHFFLSYF